MSLLRDLYVLGGQLSADSSKDFLPVGYERKPVAFVFDISTLRGSVSVYDTRSLDNKMRGVDRVIPTQKRTGSAAPPNLVCDNLQYAMAVGKDDSPKANQKAAELHAAWLALLGRAVEELDGASAEALDAIAKYCVDPELLRSALTTSEISLPEKQGEASALLCTFAVDGVEPLKNSDLQDWWAAVVSADAAGEVGVCQVTGATGPLARKFDAVKLPGFQPTLVSANFEAAERYSGSQSTGARISVGAAKRSHAALNWLLSSASNHARLGDATLVWWVSSAEGDDQVGSFLYDPDPALVAELTKGIWAGRPIGIDEPAKFRSVLLTVSTARVVVRSDQTVALPTMVSSLKNYFVRHTVTERNGAPRYFPIRRLAEAAARSGRQGAKMDEVNRLLADLLACALAGRAVPMHHLGGVLRRCRAEQSVPDARAALISLILRSNAGGNAVEHSDPYICGQIFAEYEYLQYRALGAVNRSVGDTYFASMMSHPARVVPVLESKAHHHLGRLRRDAPGAFIFISRKFAELNEALSGPYPSTLGLEQQAEFVLGYHAARYHHLNRTQKETDNE